MAELAELQLLIASTREARGFTTDPLKLLVLLVEEVGEVASELKKTWSPNYADMVTGDLANELADTFVLVSAIASEFEIDLERAVHDKFIAADGGRHWATAHRLEPVRQRRIRG